MEGEQIHIVFVFDNDAYAEEFAALNLGEPDDEDEPPTISS